MDRSTKAILAAIAVGLFLNAAASTVRTARAEDDNRDMLAAIRWSIDKIENGTCVNRVLCGRGH